MYYGFGVLPARPYKPRLAGKYSPARMEAAAELALLTGACRYRSIESNLKNSLDRQPFALVCATTTTSRQHSRHGVLRILGAHPLITRRNELGMTQVVVWCPFQELNRGYQDRLQPDAVFHLLCGETLAPPAAPGFGQIREWTLRDRQSLELPEQSLAG
jgi:hypothetical protein